MISSGYGRLEWEEWEEWERGASNSELGRNRQSPDWHSHRQLEDEEGREPRMNADFQEREEGD